MLEVPRIITQKPNHCTIASARMILSYYGVKSSDSQLIRLSGHTEKTILREGLGGAAIGSALIHKGFDVYLKMWYEGFPPQLYYLRDEKAETELRRWCNLKVKKDRALRTDKKDFLRFMDLGGQLVPRPLYLSDIHLSISKGHPFILGGNFAPLYGGTARSCPHSVVVKGIEDGRIWINGPSIDDKDSYISEEMMHACYLFNAEGLFAVPKKRA